MANSRLQFARLSPLLTLLLLLARGAFAHPALESLIEAATGRIAESPNDPDVWLERAGYFLEHEEGAPALADLEHAATLLPAEAVTASDIRRALGVQLGAARAHMGRGELDAAARALNRAFALQPNIAEAWMLRARLAEAEAEKLDTADDAGDDREARYLTAVDAYDRALELMAEQDAAPRPQLYLDRARACALAGDAHIADAIAGLDEGMARLGPISALQEEAIALELRRGATDAALARLELLARAMPSALVPRLRRAEILEAAGRREESLAAWREAAAAFDALPPSRRTGRDAEHRADTIRAALDRLAAVEAPDAPTTSPLAKAP